MDEAGQSWAADDGLKAFEVAIPSFLVWGDNDGPAKAAKAATPRLTVWDDIEVHEVELDMPI